MMAVPSTPEVLEMIEQVLLTLAETIEEGEFPEIGYYNSSRKNVRYDPDTGYQSVDDTPSFIDGRKVESAKTIAGLVYGLSRFKEHLEQGMSMSLRDFYYMNKVKQKGVGRRDGQKNRNNH